MEYIWNCRGRYQAAENDKYSVWLSGLVLLENKSCDLLKLAELAFHQRLHYPSLSGNFKLMAYSREDDSYLFFGDHAGSQYFYIDTEHALFSDSLLDLRVKQGDAARLNMSAALELVEYGRTLGDKTLVFGIKKTCSNHYYRFHDGKIEVFDKCLPTFSQMPEQISLDDVCGPFLSALGEEKVCAICTGGTDSRAILSNLIYRKVSPALLLTGHTTNPDIPIAEKIAQTLDLPLTLVSFQDREAGWLEKGFFFFDGMQDAVLSYRHLKKARHVKEKGYAFEFGGVGGEFYKNSFCLPFRQGHIRNKEKHLRQILSGSGDSRRACFGDALRAARPETDTFVDTLIRKGLQEKSLLAACNHVGFEFLKSISGSVTNSYAAVCCKIDPLMDRRLIAAVSHKRPQRLAMHIWQRRTISAYAPALSDIPTDQGYSCSVNSWKLLKERWKKLRFYASRVTARLRQKLGLRYQSSIQHYWDNDYAVARESDCWKQALKRCEELGVLRKDVQEKEIPLNKTGIILQIGFLFHNDFQGLYAKNQYILNKQEGKENL